MYYMSNEFSVHVHRSQGMIHYYTIHKMTHSVYTKKKTHTLYTEKQKGFSINIGQHYMTRLFLENYL